MDIRRNQKDKTLFHKHIKQFALKATASAIVTLNAEMAAADPCPTYITDTSLAGFVCEFEFPVTSVTVENDGEVGGINMATYTPTPPSFIVINAGGTISSLTGAGISITDSVLSNGISNSGTINSASSTGIAINSHSTINGGISNSGLISTGATDININQSTISGNILNGGTILSHVTGTGIRLADSLLNGDISNNGTISGGGNDSGVSILFNTNVNGNIINSGLINANIGNAVLVSATSTINGGIFNTGTIESTVNDGLGINISNVQSDISNKGVISGGVRGLSIHNDSTVGGNIFNSGTISGGNTGLSIFSATTINGSISNSGIISGGQEGIAITTNTIVSGNLSNTGNISGGQSGISMTSNTIISGSLSNTGNISGGQSGISITNNVTINGSLSNSGTIQGDINALFIDTTSSVSGINILGQNARIIGAVDAVGTDVNLTQGALFTTEGSYTVNQFNIEQNATLNLANTITALTVNNAGTLAVANTLQTIAGDYTQQTGSLFQIGVSSVNDYGQLVVTGAADLSQNGDINVQVNQDTLLRNGDVLFNILSGNTLIIPTNGFLVSDNSYIWSFSPTLNDANNGINLTATINPDAYNACRGTYCQGAATAIIDQVAAGNPIFNPYATLSSSNALREAASQATPELTNENIQVVQLITRSVLDIVPMWDSLRGQSSGDAMLYQPGKIWVKPYGASMTQNERNTVQGFDATAYGAVIGKDLSLPNDWLVGGGFAAGGDNMHGKSVLSGQSIHSQAYQGLLYGAKTLPNHAYFAGQALVGYEMNDTSRSIPLYASTAKGSYNSWFTNLRAETGWRTNVLIPNLIFTPELDASYLFINQNGYRESGSLMDLLVAANHNSSLVLGAYGNAAYHLTNLHNQHDLTLTGYAGLAGDVMNSQPQVISTFVASGSTFSTFGVQFNGVVFRGGAGLSLTNPTSPLIIELNYDLQTGNNAYSNIGSATIKYKT